MYVTRCNYGTAMVVFVCICNLVMWYRTQWWRYFYVPTTKWPGHIVLPMSAITRPKIIGPERNVNMICNLSLYTHIPKIKSISPSIVQLFYFGITDMGNTVYVRWYMQGLKTQSIWLKISTKLVCGYFWVLFVLLCFVFMSSEIKWRQLNIWPNFKVQWP
jgi:hypothetical protein